MDRICIACGVAAAAGQIESVVAFHASNDGGYEKNIFSREGEGAAALSAATLFANNARDFERREPLVHCVEERT